MSEDFKIGKYVIFDRNGKKKSEATIHALIQIDGILHAVFTYYYGDVIRHIRILPVEIEENANTIHFGEDEWYLTAASPVPPKSVKFQVGKTYVDDKHVFFNITDKYTDAEGITHVILNNKYVADVSKTEVDGFTIEHTNFVSWDGDVRRKIYATDSLED